MENTFVQFKNFQQFATFMNELERIDAKSREFKVDRAKNTLSIRQLINKWCQLGHSVNYKKVFFTWTDEGLGGYLVKANGQEIIGATLCDFEKEIQTVYGASLEQCVAKP